MKREEHEGGEVMPKRHVTVQGNSHSGTVEYHWSEIVNPTDIANGVFGSLLDTAALFNPMLAHASHEHKLQTERGLHSPEKAAQLIAVGCSHQGDDEVTNTLHGRLFTHNYDYSDPRRDGSLNEVRLPDLQQYFDASMPTKLWPNMILTSSHAKVYDHHDVSEPMEGFRTLIRHSFGRDAKSSPMLELVQYTDEPYVPVVGKKATLMIAAVDNAPTEDGQAANAWINGGRLIYRLNQLDRLDKLMTSEQPLSQEEFEKEYVFGNAHEQGEAKGAISPASVQLAKLMLSLIVKDPKTVMAARTEEAILSPEQPLVLRVDADKVMQHIKLVGYSRGGSIVTDAERLLILQLQHKGAVVTYDGQPMDDEKITNLMQNTGIVCVNPGIYPLSARDQALGMRRITIRNRLDVISRHFFAEHTERFKHRHDTVYQVDGAADHAGHGIEDALGDEDKLGYIIDEDKAVAADRETLRRFRTHIQAFFAPCHDKVGVSHIYTKEKVEEGCDIQFSSGTGHELIGAVLPKITQECEKMGLKNVSINAVQWHGRTLYHVSYAPDTKAYDKLAKALTALHGKDIFVSMTVYDEMGVKAPPSKRVNGFSKVHYGVSAPISHAELRSI